MGFKAVIFPVRYDKPYGLASASFMVIVVFAEIEGLVFTALGLFASRSDLFLDLQYAIAPGAFLVAFAVAAVVWLEQRALRNRVVRYTTDLSANPEVSAFADRLAGRRPR